MTFKAIDSLSDEALQAEGYRHIKRFQDGNIAAIYQFAYSAAIIAEIHDGGYMNRWCYKTWDEAVAALEKWDGSGDPDGWHRHPNTGRRRPHGDASEEYIAF